jgi:hypothetical protein
MNTNRATGPGESPVPGVIPPPPHLEADDGLDDRESVVGGDGQPPAGTPAASPQENGPIRALLARLRHKER